MEIKITEKNDRFVALLCGELDSIACVNAKKALAPLTEQTDHDVEMDCSGLEYISSSGLRLFIGIYKHQHEIGKRCIMTHVSDKLKDVFEIGGFFMLFEQEG